MAVGVLAGVTLLEALEARQSVVANNLANSSVPGFQKTLFSVEGTEMRARGANSYQTLKMNHNIERSLDSGAIKVTGNPNDFAIAGEGFFQLQGPDGQALYTRNGEFHVDADGQLVNSSGLLVQSDGGPIFIDRQLGDFSVAQDGTISQDGREIARLAIYRFENQDDLKQHHGVSFSLDEGAAQPIMMEEPTVYQGQIELSNVSPMQEMISMIEISRHYELAQKKIQQSDDLTEKTIQAATA